MGGRGSSSGFAKQNSGIKYEMNFKKEEINKRVKEQIQGLADEYENFLTSVYKGTDKQGDKGQTSIDGRIGLASPTPAVVYHEFAHVIASTLRDYAGLSNNKEFWSEIKKIRTQYRKALAKDRQNSISTYADINGRSSIDEFFAEGFALGKMRSSGRNIDWNSGFSSNPKAGEWADKIVGVTDKYFRKRKKKFDEVL